jgi:hypothetical protein
MQIHWEAKWISIPYQGTQIILQGITAPLQSDLVFQLYAVTPTESTPNLSEVPPDIAEILSTFPSVFKVPDESPPQRSCDHAIPLVSGASPVNIRAYRYPPSLKDEIDRQVKDMLQKGLIQPSTSLFSSPVLLVQENMAHGAFVSIIGTSTHSQ